MHLYLDIFNYFRDLENLDIPVYSVNAHIDIINCMDGVGGLNFNCGSPEIVTGSRDGNIEIVLRYIFCRKMIQFFKHNQKKRLLMSCTFREKFSLYQ